MSEKAELLFDAITSIRPELVEEALDQPVRRRPAWRRYGPLCACLALAACLGWFGLFLSGGMGGSGAADNNAAPPASADTAAPSEPEAGQDGGEAPGCAAPRTLTAQVVEIRENALLVRPLPGGEWGTEPVEVSLEGLETPPELEAGSRVRVSFTGEPAAGGPITGVTEIALAEP